MDNIDIIMSAYNCKEYIKQAINSVKEQTNNSWRLIIIDDFSNDNTLEIIEQETQDIKNKVEIIKLKKHISIASTRNEGLKISKARYVAYLDADDIWKKDKLEKQVNFMKINNYGFTYTGFSYLKNNRNKKVRIIPQKLNYRKALKNTFILTSTVMIDTKKIDKKLLKMPEIDSEDTACWWNILKNNHIAYGLKENLTEYRVHSKGVSFNKLVNIKKTWNLYRKYEKTSLVKSVYYFTNYIINAFLKRVI